METEIWKPIKDYEGLYEVSNMGRIRRIDAIISDVRRKGFLYKGRMLKIETNKFGYQCIRLCKNGKHSFYLVHRVVAEAFVSNPKNKKFVDHIDTNKSNNKSKNLRWTTSKENNNNELTKKHLCRPVIQMDLDGNYITEWQGAKIVQDTIGINKGNITLVCRGVKLTAGGYKWKYKHQNRKKYECK